LSTLDTQGKRALGGKKEAKSGGGKERDPGHSWPCCGFVRGLTTKLKKYGRDKASPEL